MLYKNLFRRESKDHLCLHLHLIQQQQADLILFTGDLVNDRAVEMQEWAPIFGQLSAPKGVFSTLGNHDYGDYVQWPSKQAKEANLDALKELIFKK